MGIILRWTLPDSAEATYDKTYIYRSTTETGTYTEITNQDITDNTYFDIDGSSSSWYKVRFYDTTETTWSLYSDPIQGGKFNGYCKIEDVRQFSSTMTSSNITDTQIFEFIKFATAQINAEILIEHKDELVTYISSDKENKIDGSNTTYYIRHPYLGDYNDDGIIDEDDIYVYSINAQGDRTEYTVDSITDIYHGQFELTTAPGNGEKLFFTYKTSPVKLYPTVNYNIRKAAIYLSLSMAHTRLSPQQIKSFKVNKVSVTGSNSPAMHFENKYRQYLTQIPKQLVFHGHDD